MFFGCRALKELRLSNLFRTSNVYNMSMMFYDCQKLKKIESHFNFCNVVSCEKMYENCVALKSFQSDYFNFKKVLFLEGMFNNCEKITEISFADVRNLYINSIQGLFAGCVNLTSVDFGINFLYEKLFDVSAVFKHCAKLKKIKNINSIFNKNTAQIQDLFLGCERLPKLDLNLSAVSISD